jgi:N-acetylmuramoyl-L-alanine amidase
VEFEPAYIIVHHSLTKDQSVVDYAAIRRYHMTEMGMTDIGYHGVVELAGQGFVPLLGRPWDRVGAHTKQAGMNRVALGVCLVGNFDIAPPPDAQLESLRRCFLEPWMRMFKIPPANVRMHRQYAPWKTCPGSAFTEQILARFLPT